MDDWLEYSFNIYICNLKVSFWNLWVKLKDKNMD